MKSIRLICVFSTIILATSCMVKLDQEAPGLDLKERIITITARTETEATTKTELSEAGDGAVLWTPGDEISLFCGSGTAGGRRFTSAATEAVAITDFTGTIETITGSSEATPEGTWFWGLYPYSPTATCDGSSVTMTLSAEQMATAGTFATGTAPSLGRSKNTSMGFYNICGGLKFSVTHEGIKKVTFQSNNGEPVAGTARVAFNEAGLPEVQEITSGTDSVTLEAPDGEYFEVGEYYYMMLFPTSLASGFTLTLETMTESTTVEMNGQLSVRRAIFGRMSNVDSGATYTLISGNIPIPDANFKAYMVENFDTDDDGEISVDEALLITSIEVNTDSIASVKGIEFCQNLESLVCEGSGYYVSGRSGHLTALDISKNIALTSLSCRFNQLSSLDVSNNTALTIINCDYNQLTSLDISNNTALLSLACKDNQLTSLDVSNNTALTSLSCPYNQLTNLDVSNNAALTFLGCYVNSLNSLDVSNNTALDFLSCFDNQLTSLDISNNTVLANLVCNSNQLVNLDLSNNTLLTYLSCDYNQLTSLDISNNTALEHLSCSGNQLSSLDVSNNTPLTELYCSPMNDSQSNNLLATLYIAPGQSIPHVTTNRSAYHIPNETEIVEKPVSGGNEGYDEVDLISVPQAVDLGLSVKWASFNLGASVPEGYGNYYAWGEMEPHYSSLDPITWKDGKTGYFWASYKWCDGGYSSLTKYNYSSSYGTIDNKTILEATDDVAHVTLGGNWRMPTDAEWTELQNSCTWVWTNQNGVYGRLVTSNTNGNSIFLPVAGYMDHTSLFGAGSGGYYWSSSLDTNRPSSAWLLYIDSDDVLRDNNILRFDGLSIRPVTD